MRKLMIALALAVASMSYGQTNSFNDTSVSSTNQINLYVYRTTSTDTSINDIVIQFDDDAANRTTFAKVETVLDDSQDASEDATISMYAMVAGTLTNHITLTGGNVDVHGFIQAGTNDVNLTNADGTINLEALEQDGASTGQLIGWSGTEWEPTSSTGTGDVSGPASATDNAVVRFDATTGKLIQDSNLILTDAGALTGESNAQFGGSITADVLGEAKNGVVNIKADGTHQAQLAFYDDSDLAWVVLRNTDTTNDLNFLRYVGGVFQDGPLAIDNGTGDLRVGSDIEITGDIDHNGTAQSIDFDAAIIGGISINSDDDFSVFADDSIGVDIDSDNNSTGNSFVVSKDSGATYLLTVAESGLVTAHDDLQVNDNATINGLFLLGATDMFRLDNYADSNIQDISGGSISPAQMRVRVGAEADAATDNLDSLSTGSVNYGGDFAILILQTETGGEVITVRDDGVSGGNIKLSGDANFVMDGSGDILVLFTFGNSSNWFEMFRSDN